MFHANCTKFLYFYKIVEIIKYVIELYIGSNIVNCFVIIIQGKSIENLLDNCIFMI